MRSSAVSSASMPSGSSHWKVALPAAADGGRVSASDIGCSLCLGRMAPCQQLIDLTISRGLDKLTLRTRANGNTQGSVGGMKDFKGKTAFVTGAASGIGLALARTFLDRGMNVMMCDVEKAALEKAAHGLSNHGDRVAHVLADVSVGEALEAAAA